MKKREKKKTAEYSIHFYAIHNLYIYWLVLLVLRARADSQRVAELIGIAQQSPG